MNDSAWYRETMLTGSNMINPCVILEMPFNFILSSNLSFVLSKYPVLIMAMPLNMILVRMSYYVYCHMIVYQINNLVHTCTYISLISMTNNL